MRKRKEFYVVFPVEEIETDAVVLADDKKNSATFYSTNSSNELINNFWDKIHSHSQYL